ncbi:hypothetical protein M409DRAFT_22675 [Zasmidium cellare ATCC 36951]|uniref:Tyrosinase copper-binding domain-containing protein n=1 Tax=Zasmidium cellare ATCC 36951 TaxID=1080233 RepID=A0A6A6CM00_ZASCE|nr:uncharacterized protein M409DRAFT_22675 [Zasmidium cellare ATCC 36951]KAF2167248.1 hypothetical protein M409DRAFT_22675 [Zasmidium cellare ATCC 36951]
MGIIQKLIVAFAFLCLANTKPTGKRQAGGCAAPVQRRAWVNLSNEEKQAYIQADKCLQNTPAQYGIPGARTVWDELQYVHIRQANFIHGVGTFLPWHRYYIKLHETLLSKHCGYSGGNPYWREADHADSIWATNLWDATTGMGGDGQGEQGCVADGPFAGLTLIYNAAAQPAAPYCLARRFNVASFQEAGQSHIDECFAKQSYWEAMQCYGNAVHWAGHAGVGRVMEDAMLAPGDPVFFLHHANLDRLYYEWQRASPGRVNEIAGPNTPGPEFAADNWGRPGPEFTESSGDGGGETTLNHVLWMAGMIPNATISQVLDIHSEINCADYL